MPEPGNPQAWNRYAYVVNNPLRYTDPSGHRFDEAGAGAGGGAVYRQAIWAAAVNNPVALQNALKTMGIMVGGTSLGVATSEAVSNIYVYPLDPPSGETATTSSASSDPSTGEALRTPPFDLPDTETPLVTPDLALDDPADLIPQFLDIKLTKGGRKKIGGLINLKDKTAAEAIRSRGGGASQVQQLETGFDALTVGELANLAAQGNRAAETAIKIIKQASKKKGKYSGKN